MGRLTLTTLVALLFWVACSSTPAECPPCPCAEEAAAATPTAATSRAADEGDAEAASDEEGGEDDVIAEPGGADASAFDGKLYQLTSRIDAPPEPLPGAFNVPSGIAVDSKTGDVYVSDNLFKRVQRFDADGNYLGEWPVPVSLGMGVTVDPLDSTVLLCIPAKNLVVRYTPEGQEVTRYGPDLPGADKGFTEPQDASIDPKTGDIYVIDNTSRVTVLDKKGGFLRAWHAGRRPPRDDGKLTNFDKSLGIAVDPGGKSVYVANSGSYNVAKFTTKGEELARWADKEGSEPGKLRWCRGIAVGKDGRVYVADTDNERAQIFSADGAFVKAFRGPHDDEPVGFHPRAIDVNTRTGKVYAAAGYAHRVDRFDSEGNLELSWGKRQKPEVLNDARGVVVDPESRRIYVAVRRDHLVKRFSPDGKLETAFFANAGKLEGFDPSWTVQANHQFPTPIELGRDGTVWLVRQGYFYPDNPTPAHFLRQYTADGAFLRGIEHETLKGYMIGLVISPRTGHFYITNTKTRDVIHLDAQGSYVGSFSAGTGLDAMKAPTGIAIDEQAGRLYVADSGKHRIQVFDLEGKPLQRWGSRGRGPGEFVMSSPAGLDVDECGRLYAADHNNGRVQIFASDGTWLDEIRVRAQGDRGRARPWDLDVLDKDLYVVTSSAVVAYHRKVDECSVPAATP